MRRIDSTFHFSHSLVSSYGGWLNTESDYIRYYGKSENPPEYDGYELGKKLEFYSHLFKLGINPEFEREDTALILGRDFENLLNTGKNAGEFKFENNRNETFRVILNSDFETLINNRQKNAPVRQVKIEGILPNGLNFVGYADEVYENCIIDIKTTSNFSKPNYDSSLQIPLYLHFIPDYPVQRGFYQVTEFYRSKAAGKNEFTMKDTFMIESERITESGLTKFSDMCAEILKNIAVFERDAENFRMYFRENKN